MKTLLRLPLVLLGVAVLSPVVLGVAAAVILAAMIRE